MSDNTENHGYETPAQGTENWHEPLNENFEELDIDVEVRDVAENRATYEPKEGSKFLELDTGIVYVGDGEEWAPALATAYYDDEGELDLGELTASLDGDGNETTETDAGPSTFGTNARAVHEGAIVFGDATQRSIWSKYANEIRSQMPIHAPKVGTSGAILAGDSVTASGRITANSMSTSSLSTNELDAASLSVDGDSLTVDFGGDDPHLSIDPWEVTISIGEEEPEPALIIGDGIHATMPIHATEPIYAPEFVTENESARAAKTAIEPVEPASVLSAVESLPVNTWEYRSNEGRRHIGPMAEDFAEAFELGGSDESIATVDADGVALAAIQGLAERLDDRTDHLHEQLVERDERIDSLEAENEALRSRLSALEDAVETGAAPTNSPAPADD